MGSIPGPQGLPVKMAIRFLADACRSRKPALTSLAVTTLFAIRARFVLATPRRPADCPTALTSSIAPAVGRCEGSAYRYGTSIETGRASPGLIRSRA